MKLVSPESVGLDSSVLENIRDSNNKIARAI